MLGSTLSLFPGRAALLVPFVALLACSENDPAAVGTDIHVLVHDEQFLVRSVDYRIVCDAFTEADEGVGGTLEILDAVGFSTPVEGEVWEGFIDLPPGRCSIEVRGRDEAGEVICTTDEQFGVVGPLTSLDLFLSCSFDREPPLPPTSNSCPDLFPLICADLKPGATTTACEVKFRDLDDTCDQSCDPQTCVVTRNGIACIPGPDPGVSSLVTCDADALDCEGDGILDASCTFRETDQEFMVDCIPPDGDDFSGSTISCVVRTTDGDVDCDKTETVEVVCPPVSP